VRLWFKVIMKAPGSDKPQVLKTLQMGECFGESALMTSNTTRAATVRAAVSSGAWILPRKVYEEKVLASTTGSASEEFLKGVDMVGWCRLTPS